MKVSSLCKLREFFFKKSECLHVTGSLVARSAHTPPLPLCVDPHHSAITLWSACTQASICSPALQCPLPHHSIKNCFPLGSLTEYMRFSTGDEKLTQVLPGPPAKILHGSRKWLNEEGHTHREEQKRELRLAAHLPSALLSPSGSQGASTTY